MLFKPIDLDLNLSEPCLFLELASVASTTLSEHQFKYSNTGNSTNQFKLTSATTSNKVSGNNKSDLSSLLIVDPSQFTTVTEQNPSQVK